MTPVRAREDTGEACCDLEATADTPGPLIPNSPPSSQHTRKGPGDERGLLTFRAAPALCLAVRRTRV